MKPLSNFRIFEFSVSQIAFAVFAWSLMILRFGYRYGTGDETELLSYTLFLHDPALYPHDFFIQGLHASVPNERTVMANFLLPFVAHLEVFCFIFHFLSTCVLVMGLERLASRFIRNQYLAWLAVLVSLIPLNHFALGDVEFYSDCFQASGFATAFVVWGINLFLERKYFYTSVLISLATIIQLLEGLDVMMVLCAILFLAAIRKDVSWRSFLVFTSFYAVTAGVYLLINFMGKNVSADISDQELFKILFAFRHPHHFIFAAFPKGKMFVFFALTLVSIFFFALRSRPVFQFILLGMAGVIIYAFAVDGLHNVLVGNFQFYKVTQWIKFLGVVASMGLLEELFRVGTNRSINFKVQLIGITSLSLFCWVVIVFFNQFLPYKVPFELFGLKERNDMIAICERIKDNTPPDAVFIQPFENTELKFYGQRSSFVEFKANVRNKKYVKEWYERIQTVYGVSADDELKGFDLQQKADENYYNPDLWPYGSRVGAGVTHMLVKKDFVPPFGKLILSNNSYAVYQL